MLDVERRVDVDAMRQDFLDVEIALGMTAAGRVGVGEFVDENQRRAPGEDGVDIHLVEHAALVVDLPARDDLKAFDQRLGFLAAVRLDDADHHVDPVGQSGAARHQHLVGLADAGRRAEENPQTTALLPLRMIEQRVGRGSVIGAAVLWHSRSSIMDGAGEGVDPRPPPFTASRPRPARG